MFNIHAIPVCYITCTYYTSNIYAILKQFFTTNTYTVDILHIYAFCIYAFNLPLDICLTLTLLIFICLMYAKVPVEDMGSWNIHTTERSPRKRDNAWTARRLGPVHWPVTSWNPVLCISPTFTPPASLWIICHWSTRTMLGWGKFSVSRRNLFSVRWNENFPGGKSLCVCQILWRLIFSLFWHFYVGHIIT